MGTNRRLIGGLIITAGVAGGAGAVSACGILVEDGGGEAAPPPVTALARENSSGLVYFQDSEGTVGAAASTLDLARNVAAACGFEMPDSPSLAGNVGERELEELSTFVSSVACDATALTAHETAGDIGYFVAVPSSQVLAKVRAQADALDIEDVTIEVDAAG